MSNQREPRQVGGTAARRTQGGPARRTPVAHPNPRTEGLCYVFLS
jgi:hypothetical protein